MVRKKSRLYQHAKKINQWGAFKDYQNECKKAFKRVEIRCINHTIQTGLNEKNTKPFWRFVKSRKQDFIGIAPLKKMGRLLNDSKDKAEIVLDQFTSVFTQDKGDQNMPDTGKRAKEPIPHLQIPAEV